ncbi:MAG: hypothetical protein JO024_03720 [Candidatus Eremiobacteraeota bacterium]|nr:hypothetical protein [Candidatus Eremiobacteraeota bacterium]
MRSKLLLAGIVGALLASSTCAQAIPLFAQRYQLRCESCHSVLPELNAFGNAFRDAGYRLPLPKHGTTGVAIRYQMEYEKDPAPGSRRFTPGGVLLAAPEIGALNAFLHYNFGAQGGPAGAFLAYVANYNAHTRTLYRAGLFELPLLQSPGQRLDDLTEYGYYGAHVGLNDLSLASPRWGMQIERHIGTVRLNLVTDFGEFKGSAYGGKPLTAQTTVAGSPEGGVFLRFPLLSDVEGSAAFLGGERLISNGGLNGFTDAYERSNLGLHAYAKRLDLQAEQWWGNDSNSDGFGSALGSSGGYVRLKYYPMPHLYFAVRYDAMATPLITREWVFYAAAQVTGHARLELERRQPLAGGAGSFGGALTVGFPWPPKL